MPPVFHSITRAGPHDKILIFGVDIPATVSIIVIIKKQNKPLIKISKHGSRIYREPPMV